MESLNGKKSGLLDEYRFWSSKHLQRAVDGFAFLRRSGRMDGSKFLVRPAIEMAFRLEAAAKNPDSFYRIGREEHRQNKHLLQGEAQLLAQNEKNWERFKNTFVEEFPAIPIPNLCERCDRLTIEQVAMKAKMKPYYDSHYRIYSRYTHGALHASTGIIDKVTDRADNKTIAICALVALEFNFVRCKILRPRPFGEAIARAAWVLRPKQFTIAPQQLHSRSITSCD